MADPLIDLQSLGILVVDDHKFLRSAVRQILRNFECRHVYEASDGTHAVDVISQKCAVFDGEHSLDLILCDIEMKPMNGLKLVRAIRAGLTEAPYDIPIIMLTVHSEPDMVKAALELHINGFLVKPVHPTTLFEKIKNALKNPLTIDPMIPEEPAEAEEEASDEKEEVRVNAWILKDPDGITNIKKGLEKKIVLRKATQLTAGSTVAEDVKSPAGGTLLRSGTTLTSEIIEFIQNNENIVEVRVLE